MPFFVYSSDFQRRPASRKHQAIHMSESVALLVSRMPHLSPRPLPQSQAGSVFVRSPPERLSAVQAARPSKVT